MKRVLLLLAILHSSFCILHSQVPNLINYQGRIAVGTVNFEGTGQFKFALVDAAGTTTYWSNDGTSAAGSEPSTAVTRTVTKGLYSVQLGDTTLANMTAVTPAVFDNTDVRLRVWFNDGTNGFQLLTPDQRLTSVGFAMKAQNATTAATAMTVPDGAITSAKLAPGAVGSTQIAAGTTLTPVSITGTTQNAVANTSYLVTNASSTTITLPNTANVGDTIQITGAGAGGWSTGWTARESDRDWGSVASSADGSKLVAVEYGGQIYTSADSGVNWTARESDRDWVSVASSADGSKLVALVSGGQIYTSSNSGLDLSGAVGTTTTLTYSAGEGWIPVAESQVATGAVGSAQLAAGAVTSSALAPGTAAPPVTVSGYHAALANTSYVATGATLFTFPATANVGDTIQLSATGAGGWSIGWTARESQRSWHSVASSEDGSKLVAAVDGGQIYTSADSGVSWTAQAGNLNWKSVASSADGSKLVAVPGSGRIYTSADSGATWTERESIRTWFSVASSADGSKLVAGGAQIYTSTDSGVSWTARESIRYWKSVASSADGSKLVAVVNGGQIYTSTDSGVSWTPRESNRDWYSVASSADGSKLVAVVDGGQIYTSTDSGVSWTERESNRFWRSVASSADGSKLVAVVQGGQVYTSADSGMRWTAQESNRAWWSVASSADGSKLVAVVNNGQVYTSSIIATPELGGAQGTTTTLIYSGAAWIPVVPNSKIAAGAVGSAQLANSTVTGDKIADGTIMNADIAAAAEISDSKLATLTSAGKVANSATTATTANTGSSIVLRDATGNFSANNITANMLGNATTATTAGSATNFTGSLAGDVTGTQGATAIAAGTVTGKLLTGFSSTTGTITASDTVLSAINKLNGNVALKAPLASPTFTGTVSGTFSGNGSALTGLNGANLTAGSIGSTQLAENLTLGGTTTGSFSGDGAALTSLNASNLSSGTIDNARLSPNIALRNAANTFTGNLAVGSIHTFIAPLRGGNLGADNIFVGNNSGFSNTTGTENTAIGRGSNFQSNTTGSGNVAIGTHSLHANVTGDSNSGVGMNALSFTTGSGNTAFGRDALINNSTGFNNIALGHLAGKELTTGSNNIHIGNTGVAGEGGVIRIGTEGVQTDTYLTGVIHGDGSGLNVGGVSAANLAGAANLANAATDANTFNTLVKRDATGGFTASIITATLNGNAASATTASSFTGMLAGDVIGTQGATVISDAAVTSSKIAAGAVTATQIASNAITSAKLGSNAVTSAKLASNLTLGGTTTGTFSGGGSDLTSLNASNISSGTLADARLSSNVPLLDIGNIFTSTQTLAAGTTTLAPLKLQTGVNLTTPQFGAVEFDGTSLYLTNNSGTPTRKTLAFTDSVISPTQIAAGSITSTMLADGSVGSAKLAAGAVAPSVNVSGDTQTALSNTSYVATGESQTLFTLPATANVGDTIQLSATGAGGWSIGWTARESNRNWFSVASSADGSKLVAVVPNGQIYTSTDSGANWTARESNRTWLSVASSADGSKLVAVVLGGQIYTSTNSGVSWTARESNRDWYSVASSADGSKLVAVDGFGSGFSFSGLIYTSMDSGVSWTARESNRDWFSVASSADGSKLVALEYAGQIYTSADSGVNWTARESERFWYSVASSADGSKLVAVENGGQIYTSTDSGVSWTARESNRAWSSVASSADGSKLVAVEQGGQIYTSADSGVSWTARESNRDWRSVASSADGSKLVAGDYGGQIYTSPSISGAQGTTTTLTYSGAGWVPVMPQTQIADGAVGAAQLANSSVTSDKVADGTIMNVDIAAAAAISDSKLATLTSAGKVANSATTATTANTGSSIVLRDATGGFSAAAIVGTSFTGNGANLTNLNAAALSGTIGSSQITDGTIMDADIAAAAAISDSKLATLTSAGKVANSATTATTANTGSSIVLRDATGNFSANTITAALNGNAATATTAGSATNFTGSLTGDVTGTQSATSIAAATVTGKAITGFSSTTGTITASDTILSAINKLNGNVALKAPLASPTFTGTVSGTFSGNGAALTALNATNLSTGTVGDGRLSSNVALRSSANVFTQPQTMNQTLTVGGAYFGYGEIRMWATGGNGTSGTAYLQARDQSGTSSIGLTLRTQNAGALVDAMQLTPAGNVGIGTSNPATKLDVAGTVTATGFSAGFVGIGTSAPDAALHVITTTAGSANNTAAFSAPNIGANQSHIHYGTTGDWIIRSASSAGVVTMQDSGGKVGIGTSTPTAKLTVIGSQATSGFNASYLALGGGSFATVAHGPHNMSIYADNDIMGLGFYALSDERIKNILGQSDGAADLRTLRDIQITDYRFKDEIGQGSGQQKKVIAQQVEKVFPQAVNQHTGVVPDIFKKAAIQDGWVTLKTEVKKGDRVRLISEKHDAIHEVLEVKKDSFRTDFKGEGKEVFVYGREVKDVRAVDYEAISMLNVSATQELARRLEAKDAEIVTLKKQLLDQAAATKTLAAKLAARDEALEARLAKLEQAAKSNAVKVAMKK